MYQALVDTLTKVDIPNEAKVLVPVVPNPPRYSVSLQEIVVVTLGPDITEIAVPIGNATAELAGTVSVLVDVT